MKPAFSTVRTANPFALARISGGMILSGVTAWRGLTKDARMRPVFLHSPGTEQRQLSKFFCCCSGSLCLWLGSGGWGQDLLAIEDGSGLLMNGIVRVGDEIGSA